MIRIFTLFIVIFSVTGTVWSMWLSSKIKNEDLKLKIINKEIIKIDERIRLAEAEWSFLTSAQNIEYLNNKYLKLKAIPIQDIKSIASDKTILSQRLNNSQNIIKEIN